MQRFRTKDDPHGHHRAFMKLDKNGDNRLQRHELANLRHLFVRLLVGHHVCEFSLYIYMLSAVHSQAEQHDL
eukprot:SAG31_NODE_3_length_45830_cov_42.279701_21_plen_72_part_00